MKKSYVKSLIAALLVLVYVFSFAGCAKEPANTDKETDNNSSNPGNSINNNTSSEWAVNICGRTITVPCSLSDIIGDDIKLDDADKNKVIGSTNQTFTMVPAVCGDDAGVVYFKIKTGSDAGNKEANATVLAITNNDSARSDVFKIKDNHSIGANVNDVLATYGDGYVVDSAPNADDLSNGFVMLHYGGDEGILLWFKDGKLTYVELFASERE